MKKFLKSFVVITSISLLLTAIYSFIDFELVGWFTYKIQFIMIPGFLCVGIAASQFQNGSISTREFIHVNSDSFKKQREENINKSGVLDSKIPFIIALITSGIIQISIGFVLYNI